jgi:hypothetical protein
MDSAKANFAFAIDYTAASGETQRTSVDHPRGLPVHLLDAGDPIAILSRRPAGPQIVSLGQMRVRVDDPNALSHFAHGRSPPFNHHEAFAAVSILRRLRRR